MDQMESSVEMDAEFKDLTRELGLKSGEFVVSLWLQMCIYFNCYFTPVWIVSQICSLRLKLHVLSDIHRFLSVTSLAILMAIEIPRLYLGYTGNLFKRIQPLL
ncbi:unnamed protein product, partial [Medioppia subpectinata]